MSAPTLCIFARAPVYGRVMTRLAADIGREGAAVAHHELVEDTLTRLAPMEGITIELWLDDPAHPGGRAWARRWSLPLRRQQGDDLGGRMHAALSRCLAQGSRGVVVGTDCPSVDAAYVRRALAALDDHDVVLGPAADGGYGLVGVRRAVPEMFHGISWGTATVLKESLSAASAAGASVALLEEIWDVDTAADWHRYLRER